MTDKNRKRIKNRNINFIIAIGFFVALLGLIAYIILSSAQDSPKTGNVTREVISRTGVVTLIAKDCDARSSDPNEDIRKYIVCDDGDKIRVDDTIIIASEGGPRSRFKKDLGIFHIGDRVNARYILDQKTGAPTLDCNSCSINLVSSAK
jgi:hypothetical protein